MEEKQFQYILRRNVSFKVIILKISVLINLETPVVTSDTGPTVGNDVYRAVGAANEPGAAEGFNKED